MNYHTSLQNVLKSISAGKRKQRHIAVWDIDNTLFTTPKNKLTIRIIDKNKKVVQSYTTQEYAEVTESQKRAILSRGHNFDFSDFRKSLIFARYAKPMIENINKAVVEYNDPSYFIMVLTARGDMDDKKLFLSHFSNHSLNMDVFGKSHIVRAATIGLPKHEIMSTVLKENDHITTMKFYDDSSEEIKNFKTLRRDFRNVALYANGERL